MLSEQLIWCLVVQLHCVAVRFLSVHFPCSEMQGCELVIDDRERHLIQALTSQRVPHTVEHLELGDVVYRICGKTAGILERKTAKDFAASIVDKRWTEQKSRLAMIRATLRSGESTIEQGAPVGYIFEGNFFSSGRTHSLQPLTLLKAATSAAARDGFCTLHYNNVKETAAGLKYMLEQMPFVGYSEQRVVQKLRTAGYGTEPPVLSKQAAQATDDVVFLRLLRCIPGVSPAVAQVLAARYKNLPELAQDLQVSDKVDKIQNLRRRSRGHKKPGRKIGPAICKALQQHLLRSSNIQPKLAKSQKIKKPKM